MKKQTKIQVLSPDGIIIDPERFSYKNLTQAEKAFDKWVERYRAQGYYSTIFEGQRLRISLDELKNYCDFLPVKN